jgi:hypothetical protein
MPVSKKRKKGGKPVHRQAPAAEQQASATDHPEGHGGPPPLKSGKPKNPFVSHQPQLRGSQRGR